MATLDIKACLQAVKERAAEEAAARQEARQVGEVIAQSVLDQLPRALRCGLAIRITPSLANASGAERAEALLILTAATLATWSTDWDNDKYVFCVPRCDIETALRRRDRATRAQPGSSPSPG